MAKINECDSLWSKKEYRKYIIDVDEAKNTAPYSHRKMIFKCPDCDREKEMAELYKSGVGLVALAKKYNINSPTTVSSILTKYGIEVRGGGGSGKKQVICVETGDIYSSVSEAEKVVGNKGIGKCCNGKVKSAGGYTWEFVS